MLKVIDSEKEYWVEGNSLFVQDLEDSEDCVQIDSKEFSSFEKEVYNFLRGV